MDDYVLVRITTIDGDEQELWLAPELAVITALYYPLSFHDEIYSARLVWMSDQNSRAWDMSV